MDANEALVDADNYPDMVLSRSSNASFDSASLNELADSVAGEVQSIALLREIFPEESIQELRQLHTQHVESVKSVQTMPRTTGQHQLPRSRLGNRIRNRLRESGVTSSILDREIALPHDFLRLPPEIAVRRQDDKGAWRIHVVEELTSRVIRQYERIGRGPSCQTKYCAKVIFRDVKVGLGITLYDRDGLVKVHSLLSRDGRRWTSSPADRTVFGPAIQAGIKPEDVLIGINGIALLESIPPGESLLQHAVVCIRNSPDPIVLHLERGSSTDLVLESALQFGSLGPSLLDSVDMTDDGRSTEVSFLGDDTFRSTPIPQYSNGSTKVHDFAQAMVGRGLARGDGDEIEITEVLTRFTERASQWEEKGAFRIGMSRHDGTNVFVPLHGVRQAVSVRIVNTFLDGKDTAYTLWTYDVESGREWYAPVRYFRDFQDLRSATLSLHPSIGQIAFPKNALSIFGSPVRADTKSERENKSRQLEFFVRSLCAMIYRAPLHQSMAEIAVHVQSFLGCDTMLEDADVPTIIDQLNTPEDAREAHCARIRLNLKRSMQRYTYRLFLLDNMRTLVNTFVESVRSKGPRLQDIEALEALGRSALKTKALEQLEHVHSFLDHLQDLILLGCMRDFRSIAERPEYEAIHEILHESGGEAFWDRLVREAVREQIEIEAYVPLRGVVSKWLVNGWKHEDMEVQFKIKELRKRPQKFFRIPESDSHWASVSHILREGVGLSTLPCAKLRAIVEAAREIIRLSSSEHQDMDKTTESNEKKPLSLGADDFLPIFIYCVVHGNLERPCALCVLLRTLCDRINRIGEIGYYLASFEASITHVQEIDLTENVDEMQSFLSVPLTDH